MKNKITELVFIIDRSGSMAGLENDTIGGFNSMIEKQKSEDGRCFVTTILFDNVSEILHDRIEVSKIAKMTEKDYFPRGCTALIDALGGAITHIESIHKYARPEDVPENTLFVITTDGMENASVKFSSEKVKKMIEEKKETGWEFLFIGANIDAVDTAEQYGIPKERAVNYNADATGTQILYASVSDAVSKMRACDTIEFDWAKDIQADFEKRNKK